MIQNTTRKPHTNTHRRPWLPLFGVGILVVCALFTGVFAKYAYQHDSTPGQITADNFYFTTDLTGDTVMVLQGDTDTYNFGQESTTGRWQLYGGVQHTLTIKVQNYYDDLRVTGADITYTATVSTNSAATTGADGLTVSSASGTLTGDDKHDDALTLTIPAHNSWAYNDGDTVTLTVTSTAPYEKTFTLIFTLHTVNDVLSYRVLDTVGSPYAELIIMSNVMDENGNTKSVTPHLKWPETLDIDNTNNLTFTEKNGDMFVQQDGMEGRDMLLSQPFATGRSESIVFFKTDTSANYSRPDTVVTPDSNDDYVIDLTGSAN